jgi:molybdopterin biosynthesis enzyme
MKIARLPLNETSGHLLVHNIVDATGRRIIRKGVQLTTTHLARLRELGYEELDVAVLAADDVAEDTAAAQLAHALQTPELVVKPGVGGRTNIYSGVRGVFYVDVPRLAALNSLPGVTLATLPQYAVVHPREDPLRRGKDDQVATLKIIPYAIPSAVLHEAIQLASGAPILTVRPLPERRVALLVTGDKAAQPLLRAQFEPAVRQRLERLGSTLDTVVTVIHEQAAIAAAAQLLLAGHDMLIVAGQTSIMDEYDVVLAGLQRAGAAVILHGAPVDPGNLLALAAMGEKPILCAPGCARSMATNVVDLILPRMLAGEVLNREEMARLALGGLLH